MYYLHPLVFQSAENSDTIHVSECDHTGSIIQKSSDAKGNLLLNVVARITMKREEKYTDFIQIIKKERIMKDERKSLLSRFLTENSCCNLCVNTAYTFATENTEITFFTPTWTPTVLHNPIGFRTF